MKKEDPIICRCEDVRLSEIKNAIKIEAKDLSSIKRITRAGMGTCQGKICENLISGIIRSELGCASKNISLLKIRPPIYPIKIKGIAEVDELHKR